MKKIFYGFTLVELLIVIAVASILTSIAVPSYKAYLVDANMAKISSSVDAYKRSIEDYYGFAGSVPTSFNDLEIPNDSGYINSTSGNLPLPEFISQIFLEGIESNSKSAVSIYVPVSNLGVTQIGIYSNIILTYVMDPNGAPGLMTWSCSFSGGTDVYNDYLPPECT